MCGLDGAGRVGRWLTGADGIGATVAAADFAQSGREGFGDAGSGQPQRHDDVGPDAGLAAPSGESGDRGVGEFGDRAVVTIAGAGEDVGPFGCVGMGEDPAGLGHQLCGDSAAGRA